MARQADVVVGDLPALAWAPAERAESLEALAGYVVGEAQQAIGWYLRQRRSRRLAARFLRLLALLAVAVAAAVPILAEMWQNAGVPVIQAGFAALALLVAGTCVGIDRFFGFSSAWMRFITAELAISDALHRFHFDWQTLKAGWATRDPDDDQLAEGLAACRALLVEVHDTIREETGRWVEEFRSAIEEIDTAARARAEVGKRAAANVVVTNGDQSEGGWRLSVDGGGARPQTGRTAALTELAPGQHRIAVEGTISGQRRRAEAALDLPAGVVADVELTLA
jgi:hypothetical protein